MNDLETSEKVVADILTVLMPRGLNPLYIQNVSDVTDQNISDRFLRSVLLWLEREGLIAFEYVDRSHVGDFLSAHYRDTVLTSKGFRALGYQFDPANGISIGEAAKKVSAGEASYARAGNFVGGLLGGFTKSMG